MAKTQREKVLEKLVKDIGKVFEENDKLEAAEKLNEYYNATRETTRDEKTILVKKYTATTLERAFKKAYPKYYENKTLNPAEKLIKELKEKNNPEE